MTGPKMLASIAGFAILAYLNLGIDVELRQKNVSLGSCFADEWIRVAAESNKKRCMIPQPGSQLRRPSLSSEQRAGLRKQTIV